MWKWLLQSVLVGKAQQVYAYLDGKQSANYDTVINAVLNGYEMPPEAYQQQFRYTKKQEQQTYADFG